MSSFRATPVSNGVRNSHVRESASTEAHSRRRLSSREELDVLIRARYPLIYVESWEEERVEQELRRSADASGKQLFVWTVTQGIVSAGSESGRCRSTIGRTVDPLAALDAVIEQMEPAIFLFKDFHPYMSGERSNISIVRKLRDVSCALRDTYKTLVVSAPFVQIAPDLAKDVSVVEFELPRTRDVSALLDQILEEIPAGSRIVSGMDASSREHLLHAARGLTLKEAENLFAKMLILDGKLDGTNLGILHAEKRRIVRQTGLLECIEASDNFDNIAGLANLKQWISKRTACFTRRNSTGRTLMPRGVLLLGVQGCGKSLCAKAIAGLWKVPLLRLDLGRLFGSLVGVSEQNIRRALEIVEGVSPAVLWIDEIDKGLAGSWGPAAGDGGTSARVFSTLVTWLSERISEVFVVATANNVHHMPPELLRKGRFDEIFFVDLPNLQERAQALRIHLRIRKLDPDAFGIAKLAAMSDGFSGAELEAAINSALVDALSDGVKLSDQLLREAIGETFPLSRIMSEEIAELRRWARGRVRFASETNDIHHRSELSP